MVPSPQESVLSGRKRAIEELVRGHGYAKELEDIFAALGKTVDNPELTRDLVEKVLSSFNNSLSALSHVVEFEEVSQVDVARPLKRFKPNSSEGSEGSVRSSLATPRDRRGCYKRRCDGETWVEFTPSMNADHHQWRKYGQKSILHAVHPRNYFRCSHKIDQGCLATKQVQQISDDPINFRTVYQGRHTCTDNRRLKSPEIVNFDDNGSNNLGNGSSSFHLSFEGNNTAGAAVKKEETSEGCFGIKGTAMPSASSDNNYLGIFGPGGDISALSSDPGDVMSSGHHGIYMDMVMGWDDPADFELDYGSSGDFYG